MCDICLRSPCHPRCPNAEPPAAVYDCSKCKEGIIPGEKYARIDGLHYHLDCLEDMGTEKLLEFLDVDVLTAREDW